MKEMVDWDKELRLVQMRIAVREFAEVWNGLWNAIVNFYQKAISAIRDLAVSFFESMPPVGFVGWWLQSEPQYDPFNARAMWKKEKRRKRPFLQPRHNQSRKFRE